MTWADLDWASLGRHRDHFLGGKPCDGPYWSSESDVASYDLTFGERIGWKWDAVLDELVLRGWSPRGGTVLDWGCGSGIAGRRVIARFDPTTFASLVVWDHSPVATVFAHDAAKKGFPELDVSMATPGFLNSVETIDILVLSHVLNELQPAAVNQIRALASRSRVVLWTEPGNRETSRLLGTLRDELAAQFHVVAPCTHGNGCPVLTSGNERHWCHHFAAPPSAIFTDSNWVKFGKRAGIDLRSLPYSFVALDRNWRGDGHGLSRIIGRPENFKPYVRLLNCDASGLSELNVPKRTNKSLCKELERTKRPLVYRWTRHGQNITAGGAVDART